MILMGDRFTIRFLVSGLPAERVKFGFFKDYAIRGKAPWPGNCIWWRMEIFRRSFILVASDNDFSSTSFAFRCIVHPLRSKDTCPGWRQR